MKVILLIILSTSSFQFLFAQTKLPIFQSQQDSADHVTLTRLINAEFMEGEKVNGKKVDSLVTLRAAIAKRITGYRYYFIPSYALSDQLNQESKDTVTALSIVGKSKIPREVYQCKNLKTFELINTRIKRIPRKLRKLHQLNTIKVYSNKITKPLKLAKNHAVKNLILCSDGIPKKFNSYRSLQTLDLSKNNLKNFPNIRGCQNLKELSLRENNITLDDLPNNLNSNLESLELQYNQIKSIPASLGSLTKLKKLTLDYNQISSIDPNLSSLKNLEQIALYQNNLTTVPDALYALNSLKEIDLYYNPIERLESKVANWKNLQVLYLANNKLLSLPDNIGELKSLRELYLHHNGLSTLPESLGELHELRILRINQNHLNTLPESLARLANIENMDIAGNYLQTLPKEVFQFKHLKILSLFNNPWNESTREIIHTQAVRLKEKEVTIYYDGSEEETAEE